MFVLALDGRLAQNIFYHASYLSRRNKERCSYSATRLFPKAPFHAPAIKHSKRPLSASHKIKFAVGFGLP